MKCPNIMRGINQPNGTSFSIDYGLTDLASFFAIEIVPAPTWGLLLTHHVFKQEIWNLVASTLRVLNPFLV